MKYYKIIHEDKTHNGLTYKEGLNIDPVLFDPRGSCRPGGIYFARKNILAFIGYGSWICEVILPDDAKVYKDPGELGKWKADKVILGEFKRITSTVIEELIEEGADMVVGGDYVLFWAAARGYTNIVKRRLELTTTAHNDVLKAALYHASRNNHIETVKYLIEAGVDINAYDDIVIYNASKRGDLALVKYCIEHGADVHEVKMESICKNGHLDVAKYLVEQGVSITIPNVLTLITKNSGKSLDIMGYAKLFLASIL